MSETENPPPGPELNLLRALKPGTIDMHKAVQRLLLQQGGRYLVAPQFHDWDHRPYAIRWPLSKEWKIPALLVFPWDRGTGQSLAEYCQYYKFEIPRNSPQTLVVTSTPLRPEDLAAAEKILKSPISVLQLVDGDLARLAWIGREPAPDSFKSLAAAETRRALQDVDPGEFADAHHKAQPKDPGRKIEADLIMPIQPSSYFSYSLMLINIAVYILAVVKSSRMTGQLDQYATPVLNEFSINALATQGEWWRFLTAGFMHIGILHLVFNMWFLFRNGPVIESMLGRGRFLAVYFAGLLGCSLFSFSWHIWTMPYALVNAAGASGALCGIIYGLAAYIFAVRKVLGRSMVRAFLQQVMWFTIILAVLGLGGGVDNAGHFGGGLAGAALGYSFGIHEKLHPRWLARMRWLPIVAVALLFLLLAGMAWPQAQALANGGTPTMAKLTRQGDALDEIERHLQEAIDDQRSSPELLAELDRFQKLSLEMIAGFRQVLRGQPSPEFVDFAQEMEARYQLYRQALVKIAIDRLIERVKDLRRISDLTPDEPFPAQPPNDAAARAGVQIHTLVPQLLAWPGTAAERKLDAQIDDDLNRLEAIDQQIAGWKAPAAASGAPTSGENPAAPAAPPAPAAPADAAPDAAPSAP